MYATNFKNNLWYKDHILNTLQKISNLTYCNPSDDNIHDVYEYNKILLKRIKSAWKIDLFFSMANDYIILPETVQEIKKLWILTVNLSFDDLSRSFDLIKMAKCFDYMWVIEPEAVKILKSYWANPIYLPMAANPDTYKPYPEEKEIYDAVLVWFKNSSRPQYIYKLLDNDIDVKVWWYWWKAIQQNDTAKKRALANPFNTIRHIFHDIRYSQWREWLWADFLNVLREPKPSQKVLSILDKHVWWELNFEDMIKLYSQAKISLWFNERLNTYQFKKPSYIMRLRDFEAPMSWACHLMYRIPEMLKYFEEDKEMLFYSSFEELLEKIRFYTKPENDWLRKKIKENARKRALRDHTWENRFNELFKIIWI
ncbi:MAG: hypothetical protein ACD_80C00151G0010 [uncultured bacterium (gcode 4)]|uniref:Spore protein YkvP/CgeB glycosyl transferase-like domain-containing protein n=1 Tax=uncultured bacterium (gcode 4) TaxID=1234023 RepID=K1X3Y6_9BACT|nr:MAG: hypothetical protein ACD_80C00151G0010 [uncultured bacterium (gcode 4)]